MTAGLFIGAFEGDNTRSHHTRFLKTASILHNK